jgi:hypothetical protein
MSAKTKYGVSVVFEIRQWEGDWDGREFHMEPQWKTLCESFSQEYVEAFFKRICAEQTKPQEPTR